MIRRCLRTDPGLLLANKTAKVRAVPANCMGEQVPLAHLVPSKNATRGLAPGALPLYSDRIIAWITQFPCILTSICRYG